MAPTSDERAAIARALRGDPTATSIEEKRDGFEGMTYHEAAYRFWDLCRRVASVAKVDIARSTCSVLADLIDPTCEVKRDNPYMSDFDFTCKSCREHFRTCGEPRYCPGCGRRIEHVK